MAAKNLEEVLWIVKAYGLKTDKAADFDSTLNVQGAVTLQSTLNVTGSIAGPVAATTATVSSTLDVTGASTLGGAVNYKRQVTDTGGAYATPIALTEAQSGRVIIVDDAAGLDFTLPALAAAQIGTHYKFIVTVSVTSNNFRVVAGSGDILYGGVVLVDFDTADANLWCPADGSNDLTMAMNGTTTGGKMGTWVEFIATSATQWFVHGVAVGDGTLATPFS